MRRIGTGLRGLGRQGRVSGAAISAGIGVAAAGAVSLAAGIGTLMASFAAARAAGDFEQTMARVGALSRATGAELRQLSDAAVEAGLRTQFSPTEAAEGLAELAVRGFQASEAISALTGTLDLAQGGQISVAQASATVGAALRAFSLNADQAGITTDQLLRISNVTALQANELELALGNVARGAGLARQSIEEMLPAIGLVRNTGVQASVAASSVSSALLFMARNASEFDSVLGRTNSLVDESTGEFRDFLDVVLETSTALESRYTNQADRARVATELFGRFGLTAFSAISNQLTQGVRNAEGQIVRGAEAIQFLRKSMTGAAGAAEEFRERLQNTFQGQVRLLRGTVQTLAVVAGGPFGRAFMPILRVTRLALTTIIKFFRAIPERAQTVVAALIMLGGVFATLAGSVTLIGIAIAVLIPFLKAAAITIGVLTVALGGIVVVVSSVTAAIGLLYVAARRNLGGFGDFVRGQVQRIQLVWSTLVDLFTHGGVREGSKILAPQNRGLLQFALNVFAIGRRIVRGFEGIRKGFTLAFEQSAPALESMIASLQRLGRVFGFLGNEQGRAAATASPMQSFFESGADLGMQLAHAIEFIAGAIENWADFTRGLLTSWESFMSVAGPGIQMLMGPVRDLGMAMGELLRPLLESLGLIEAGDDSMASFGEVVAVVAGVLIGGLANGLGVVVRIMTFVVNIMRVGSMIMRQVWRIARVGAFQVGNAFRDMADEIVIALSTLIEMLGGIAEAIPAGFRPQFADDLIRAGQEFGREADQRRARQANRAQASAAFEQEILGDTLPAREVEAEQIRADFGRVFTTGFAEAMAAARPAVAEREPAPDTGAEIAARARSGEGREAAAAIAALATEQRKANQQPIVVQVVVDGEVVDEQRRTRGEAAGRQVGTGG